MVANRTISGGHPDSSESIPEQSLSYQDAVVLFDTIPGINQPGVVVIFKGVSSFETMNTKDLDKVTGNGVKWKTKKRFGGDQRRNEV